ncbi:hypothetical protein TNCV_695761 [Trichonephila clavipes]|nr:hypothetical protein TNCV_695761 [Trichonephila clavipes]
MLAVWGVPLLKLLSSIPKPNIAIPNPAASTLSSRQAHLFPATSLIAATLSEPQPPNSTSNDAPSITSNTSPANSSIQPPSVSTTSSTKLNS